MMSSLFPNHPPISPPSTTHPSKEHSHDHIPPFFRLPKLNGLDLFEITIDELQKHFSNGTLTSVDVTQFCLDRIQKLDPYLEAVMEVNPDALSIAKEMDEERKRGQVRGVLHGVPVLVKDNIATKDGMQTTAGSWALLGSIPPRDAHVILRLREAGAIPLGKTNMCEWAGMRSRTYSSGYSPRRGQSRNPYDLSKTAFGSSSGSAIAISSNIVPFALGTETDTSVIGPASICGIVGIKPTVGLTSRSGVIPISENFDTVGVFGRTVRDAAVALGVIAGVDERDGATLRRPDGMEIDYGSCVGRKEGLRGAKFGLPVKGCWEEIHKEIRVVAEKVWAILRDAGAEVIETEFPCAEERIPPGGWWDWEYGTSTESEFTVVKVDAYNGINAYLSECTGTSIKTFEDIVAYNQGNSGTEGASPGEHPAYPTGQDHFYRVLANKGIKDATFHAALAFVHQKSRAEGIDAALKYTLDGEEKEFDALLVFDRKGAGQQMAAQAGYPIVTIPVGLDSEGIPIGLSLQHTAWRERDLIKWAGAIEDLLRDRFGPRATPGYQNYSAKNIPVRAVMGGMPF